MANEEFKYPNSIATNQEKALYRIAWALKNPTAVISEKNTLIINGKDTGLLLLSESHIEASVKRAIDGKVASQSGAGLGQNGGDGVGIPTPPPTVLPNAAASVVDVDLFSRENIVIGGRRLGADMTTGFRRFAVESRDGVDTAGLSTIPEQEIFDILAAADKAGTVAVLPAGVVDLSRQITINSGSYPNLKGIEGQGIGRTVLKFSRAQTVDWNPDTNRTDAREQSVILIDGMSGKTLKGFSVWYTGEFYRKANPYFGSVNNIYLNNTSNCLIDSVESTGANRHGIFVGANGDAYENNMKYHRGEMTAEQLIVSHGRNNTVMNCYLHHNRVSGLSIENQFSPKAIGNTASWNGHVNSGGTGYGIATSAGSVNVDVLYENNLAEYNYRKGLDSHDALTLVVRNNTIRGNRLYGFSHESRGFPSKHITFSDNVIIHDPNFRLALDDGHDSWEKYKNMDYYRWFGIHFLNKQQTIQNWKGSPDRVDWVITGNYIGGIDHDGRGIHRIVELRNKEQDPNVRIYTQFTDNIIRGRVVDTFMAAVGETTAFNGIGHVEIKRNDIKLEQFKLEPIWLQETNATGFVHGSFDVSENIIDLGTSQSWVGVFNAESLVRPLLQFKNNKIVNKAVPTKAQLRFSVAVAANSKLDLMDNVWEMPKDAAAMTSVLVNQASNPASSINLYNNRMNSRDGDLIPVGQFANNPQGQTVNMSIEAPKPKLWKEVYLTPSITVEAPNPAFKAVYTSGDSSLNGDMTLVRAGNHPPVGYSSMFDTSVSPHVARVRLANNAASAGVYMRADFSEAFSDPVTVVFPIKVLSIGARGNIGVAILGGGISKAGVDSIGKGGISIVAGSAPGRFKFVRMGVYVDGVVYRGEELELDTQYVIGGNLDAGNTYMTFGTLWNGNGQVSADIAQGFEIHKRILTAAEHAAVALKIINEINTV